MLYFHRSTIDILINKYILTRNVHMPNLNKKCTVKIDRQKGKTDIQKESWHTMLLEHAISKLARPWSDYKFLTRP